MGIVQRLFAPGSTPDAPEDRNYSDVVTNALINAAADTMSDGYVAALEVAAGQLSRAFAAATVPPLLEAVFTPDVLAQMGRSIVESGEAVWYRVGRRLIRAVNYSLSGGVYDVSGASGTIRRVAAERVVHARWNVDTASNRGVAPLQSARMLRDMQSKLEMSLGQEAGAAVGYLLPIPQDGAAGTVEQLRKDLADLKGRIAVVETTRGGWSDGTGGAPRRDYDLARMGANFPSGNVALYQAAHNAVLAACGYPVQLATDSDGTAQREAWRRYLHGTVAPLGRLIETAARAAGLPLALGWDNLFASDVMGRARAFQSLVNGGMSLEAAAAASGILNVED